ncbi:uncharacterized protein BKCO1_6000048 [Diplodia corticola]|uniref:Uncharacterized protein n=1 Tax=Diplodia corticola TaxID=236234 RepID=A0A1J9QPU5_9PEZI|nr:uncharacterized protein BKCO1_6000048 [Diplodia corticola]OJD30480.1 hypothetical protein BKCO1_6000048 [Diplodia corticola]
MMLDDVLPDAPMAVIPGDANDGILGLLSPKSTFSQEQQQASAPVLAATEPQSQRAPTLRDLTDEQLHAMLAASCGTPPPFETVNPSALSSPGPATDFSGSDDSLATHATSPFHPANHRLFGEDYIRTSLSCPPTPGQPPLPAPTARRYSNHLSLHDDAYTEPYDSPVAFPLNDQLPDPVDVDHQPRTCFTLHQKLQDSLMQEDDRSLMDRPHHQLPPRITVLPHNQALPHAPGPSHHQQQYASSPNPPPYPHPYPQAQQQQQQQQQQRRQHLQAQQQQQQPSSSSSSSFSSNPSNTPAPPPPVQITFHRQSGHFIGQPRPRQHPYPPAAAATGPPRQTAPTGYYQTVQGQDREPNVNLLSRSSGTVRIGTPVMQGVLSPPSLSSSSSSASRSTAPSPAPYRAHPHHPFPPPADGSGGSGSSGGSPAFSPVRSFGAVAGATVTADSPRQQQQHQRESGGISARGRTRSNTAPTTTTMTTTTTSSPSSSPSPPSPSNVSGRQNGAPPHPHPHPQRQHHHHRHLHLHRQAPYPSPYPSPRPASSPSSSSSSSSPLPSSHHPTGPHPFPHRPHPHPSGGSNVNVLQRQRQQRQRQQRRLLMSSSTAAAVAGPTSAPRSTSAGMVIVEEEEDGDDETGAAAGRDEDAAVAVAVAVEERHALHQRMWTPEPGGGGGGGGGGDCGVAEGVGGRYGGGGGGGGGGEMGLARLVERRREQDTLILGIQGFVERIGRECEGLSGWVREAVEERGEGEEKGELERKCLEKRNRNFAVTELDEPLEPLPRSMQMETDLEEIPWDVPPNAQEIRNSDHDAITALLEAYSVPFQPDMFLAQKKELYLRFIGANRALMHRVLD